MSDLRLLQSSTRVYHTEVEASRMGETKGRFVRIAIACSLACVLVVFAWARSVPSPVSAGLMTRIVAQKPSQIINHRIPSIPVPPVSRSEESPVRFHANPIGEDDERPAATKATKSMHSQLSRDEPNVRGQARSTPQSSAHAPVDGGILWPVIPLALIVVAAIAHIFKFRAANPTNPHLAMMGLGGKKSYLKNKKNEEAKMPSNDSQCFDRREFIQSSVAIITAATVGPSSALAADSNSIETKANYVAIANKFVSDNSRSSNDPLSNIPWDKPKERSLNMDQLADAINDGLIEDSWFVTGLGRPEYFADSFKFEDPQVSLVGFENYCRGVRRLFDQDTAKCEVICCSVTKEDEITVLWRNEGKVNIGGLQIELKPYLVTTRFKTDGKDGNLIVSQEDEFESDALGLLLYQIPMLRFLAGEPAPSVEVLNEKGDFRACKI